MAVNQRFWLKDEHNSNRLTLIKQNDLFKAIQVRFLEYYKVDRSQAGCLVPANTQKDFSEAQRNVSHTPTQPSCNKDLLNRRVRKSVKPQGSK